MSDKKNIIKELIRKESLRIIKESQVSFLTEASTEVKHSMEDVNDVIGLFEKKLEKLNNEEKSSRDKEDYLELRRIKEEQLSALTKVINGYTKKLELLKIQKEDLQLEINNVHSKGAGVFKNQEMNEFTSEGFEKGWGFRIETTNYNINLVKIGEHNAYKVMSTNVNGLQIGDLLQLPDMTLGSGGSVKVFRKVGARYENVANYKIENIIKMIKNPN